MKKIFVVIAILGIGIVFMFLIFKVLDIFGFWTLIWTGIVSLGFSVIITFIDGSRKEVGDTVTFNPKEWPKFISIIVSLVIGYYLLTIINNVDITNSEYVFGLTYLILLTLIPSVVAIYKLIRDRNDYIIITKEMIKYKDNNDLGEFLISDIKSVEIKSGIKMTFSDDTTFTIKTNQMNFNSKDLSLAYKEIKTRLSANNKPDGSLKTI